MVFNCAAVFKDNKVHLIYRARGEESSAGAAVSRLGYAVLKNDGLTLEKRYDRPIFEPEEWYELAGCEDPRITEVDNKYYMLYTAYFGSNPPKLFEKEKFNIAIASSTDLINWERKGFLLPAVTAEDKNGVLFPKRINGLYVLYYRVDPHIYVAYAKTLEDPAWFGHKLIFSPRENHWDALKIGAGAPPIETEKGWLFIYHGVDKISPLDKQIKTVYGTIDYRRTYRLGIMLIDKNDPEKIIYRSKGWILEPKEKYERDGIIPNVVFSCGAVVIGDTLFVYYGGADTVVGVATCRLSELLKNIEDKTV